MSTAEQAEASALQAMFRQFEVATLAREATKYLTGKLAAIVNYEMTLAWFLNIFSVRVCSSYLWSCTSIRGGGILRIRRFIPYHIHTNHLSLRLTVFGPQNVVGPRVSFCLIDMWFHCTLRRPSLVCPANFAAESDWILIPRSAHRFYGRFAKPSECWPIGRSREANKLTLNNSCMSSSLPDLHSYLWRAVARHGFPAWFSLM